MGLYNFKKQFVPHILNGSKTHTIRAQRKIVDKPGDTMHLYTGLRQRGAQLLMRVPCLRVEPVLFDPIVLSGCGAVCVRMFVFVGEDAIANRQSLTGDECEALARRDGFADFHDMQEFWADNLPFRGHIYHWDFKRRMAS